MALHINALAWDEKGSPPGQAGWMRPLEMPSRQAHPQREQTGRLGQFDECFVPLRTTLWTRDAFYSEIEAVRDVYDGMAQNRSLRNELSPYTPTRLLSFFQVL